MSGKYPFYYTNYYDGNGDGYVTWSELQNAVEASKKDPTQVL